MKKKPDKEFLPMLISFGALVVFWKLLSVIIGPGTVAPPEEVLSYFFSYPFSSERLAGLEIGGSGSIGPHIISTVIRYLIGVSVGITVGVLLGLAMAYSKRLREFLEPPFEVLRTIPQMALVPFFVMWIGPKPMAQILMIVFYSILMLVVNILNAVDNIHPDTINFARTLGANRKQVFTTVVVHAILPELTGGIRVVLAFSWGLEVVSELVGTSKGLGMVIQFLIPVLLSGGIIAIVLWIVSIALIFDAAFMRIARWMTRWMPEQY